MHKREFDSGDIDYYDLDFRIQNPDVYGNDEYMKNYYGNSLSRKRQQPTHNIEFSWGYFIFAIIVWVFIILILVQTCK